MALENTLRCIPTLEHTQKITLFPCRGDRGCSWLQIHPAASPFCPLKAQFPVLCLPEGWVQPALPSSFELFLQQRCAELQTGN